MDNIPINDINSNKIEGEIEKNDLKDKSGNKMRKNRHKSLTIIPHKIEFNLNSKYDNALLEELYYSKDKSWRNDIINSSPDKDKENKDKKKKKYQSNENLFFDTKQNLNIDDNNEINYKNAEKEIKNNNKVKDKETNDRFKDFDEILILEDNKDKKRKNSSEQQLISVEKLIKIPKPEKKKKSSLDFDKEIIKDKLKNLDIIEEVMEKEDKNKKEIKIK